MVVGSLNDASIFASGDLAPRLENRQIQLPPPRALPNTNIACPHFFICDGGFGIKTYLMKPFIRNHQLTVEQTVYNYRHSHARRIVESAFGLLARRWLVHQAEIKFKLSTAEDLIMSSVCIHNFLITSEINVDERNRRYALRVHEQAEIDAELANAANDENAVRDDEFQMQALQQRQILADYFSSPAGAYHWQWAHL